MEMPFFSASRAWKIVGLGIALAMSGVAFAITQNQALVAPSLVALKFEHVPSKVIGGPQEYAVTQATIDLLTRLMKEKKHVTLENNGALTVPN